MPTILGANTLSSGYDVANSLRFNSADSARLTRTQTSGDRNKATFSAWVKRSKLGANQGFFGIHGASSDAGQIEIRFQSSGEGFHISGHATNWRRTSASFRDVSAWYHLVVAFDTTLSTAGDRVKVYVNGVQTTAFAASGNPDEDSFIATNEDGEEIEVDYDDIVRFHNDNDSIMKNLRKESIKEPKKRRYTVKEVRMWMKKLEENRYKKVYNSDARRVAWMVNNEGVELSEMPKSMSKKWTKAQYGRERYLAKEFLKSKSEQLSETKFYAFFNKKKHTIDGKSLYDAKQKAITKLKVPKSKVGLLAIVNAKEHDRGGFQFEQKLREKIREIIKEQMNEKINLGGAYEKMLDKHNDKIAQNALSLVRNKIMKDYKVGKKSPKSSEKVTRRLVATLINNGMKEIRNKAKSPGLKKHFKRLLI